MLFDHSSKTTTSQHMENERAFLVEHTQIPYNLEKVTPVHITQWYLSFDSPNSLEVRVRRKSSDSSPAKYEMQIKGGIGVSRTETDPLPLTEEFVAQLNLEARPSVEKLRYKLSGEQGEVLEIDQYLGAYDGDWRVEVEFDTHKAATSYKVPAWFGTEVTHNPELRNAGLARKAFSKK